MAKFIINTKLTDSAKKALDESAEYYRKMLLEHANLFASEREAEDREISLRDMIEAEQWQRYYSDQLHFEDNHSKIQQRQQQLSNWTIILSLSGLFYSLSGIIIYLYNRKFTIGTDYGILISLFGTLSAIMALTYFLVSIRSSIKSSLVAKEKIRALNAPKPENFDIVRKWSVIERLTILAMESKGDNTDQKSLNKVIDYLIQNFSSSEEEKSLIKGLLNARNKIAHNATKFPEYQVKQYISLADKLISRLELVSNNA